MFTPSSIPDTKVLFEIFAKQIFSKWTEKDTEKALQLWHFEVQSFPQVWGSSALGFDETPDGKTTIGCSVMTTAPTTVIFCKEPNIAGVFFGSSPAYVVQNPQDMFWEDVAGKRVASISEAKKRY